MSQREIPAFDQCATQFGAIERAREAARFLCDAVRSGSLAEINRDEPVVIEVNQRRYPDEPECARIRRAMETMFGVIFTEHVLGYSTRRYKDTVYAGVYSPMTCSLRMTPSSQSGETAHERITLLSYSKVEYHRYRTWALQRMGFANIRELVLRTPNRSRLVSMLARCLFPMYGIHSAQEQAPPLPPFAATRSLRKVRIRRSEHAGSSMDG